MPTLRELRPENRRSAVSRTIACRSARLRRTGVEMSAAGAKEAAAVTRGMVHHRRDGAVRGTPRVVALGDEGRPVPARRRGALVPLWRRSVRARSATADAARGCEDPGGGGGGG